MAQLGYTINKADLPEDSSSGDYTPLPEGWYDVQVTGAEVKDTKSGTGQYIKVEYTIVGQDYAGRKVWGMLNIKNDNDKAEEIGRQELNKLMSSIGIESLTDTDQLVGPELSVKLKIRPAQGEYGPSNDVKGYKAKAKAAAGDTTKTDGSAPPWSKK